ncbi:hypothetical protein OFM93_31580, partial [Escherichia coli]|nr:hypothetical protein [Escherichia coli]
AVGQIVSQSNFSCFHRRDPVSFFKRTPTIVPDLPPEGSGYLATLKAVKGGYLCTFATEQSPVAK